MHNTSLIAAIDRVRAHGGIFLILAGPGTGKSHLLDTYVQARPTQDVVGPIFRLRTEVVNTPLGVVQSLLAQLDMGWNGPTRAGLTVLNSKLKGCPLLLVDDAHRLTQSVLELLRTLHELRQFRLVLCGPLRLHSVLLRKCPELAHRVTGRFSIENFTLPEVQSLLAPTLQPMAPALRDATAGNPFWLHTVLDEARRLARQRHQALARALHDALQKRSA